MTTSAMGGGKSSITTPEEIQTWARTTYAPTCPSALTALRSAQVATGRVDVDGLRGLGLTTDSVELAANIGGDLDGEGHARVIRQTLALLQGRVPRSRISVATSDRAQLIGHQFTHRSSLIRSGQIHSTPRKDLPMKVAKSTPAP